MRPSTAENFVRLSVSRTSRLVPREAIWHGAQKFSLVIVSENRLCVGVWVCGCVGAWVHGCVGVWVCGCVGVWVWVLVHMISFNPTSVRMVHSSKKYQIVTF